MKMLLLSIYDLKGQVYSPPMAHPNLGVAIRAFGDEVLRSDSIIGKHPEDYELRCVGSLDALTGVLEPANIETVTRASDHVHS